MGNIASTESKGAAPPSASTLFPIPPPPETIPIEPPQSQEGSGEVKEEDDGSPGTMEDIHKKCKEVYPVNFEGARLMVNKALSNHFQISHTLNLSSVTPSGYKFGATYIGNKSFRPQDVFPVLLGDIDPSGNVNANIFHQMGPHTKLKLACQIQNNKFAATQASADYRGNMYTASLTFGNLDIINDQGIVVAHYLQNVTDRVALGAELVYQYGAQVMGGEIAVLSCAARYTAPDFIVSSTLGWGGLHVCYYQKASEQVQIGVEFDSNLRAQENLASIGYQVDLNKANLVFKGTVDSNWTIGAVLEKKLMPLPFTFALGGVLNHSKNQFRLGCGLIIG